MESTGHRLSNGGYRNLVEKASDVTAVIDADGQISYVNAAVERILGYNRSELPGDAGREYVHPEDEDAFVDAIADLRDGQVGQTVVEFRCRRADGTWTWLEATMRGVHDDEFDGVIVNGRDVTERKEREAELRTTKERMTLALEGANLGVWDWDMETDEVVRDELLTEMLGYSPSEMGDHLDDWVRVVHPRGKKRHDEALTEHIEKRTPYYQSEYRLETKSGDWKWVRTIGKVVERDETGEPVRAVGIHQDIDDRKRTELTLEAERDMFREGPAVVFKWEDEDGWPIDYVSENVESVLGYDPEELQSTDLVFADIVHDEDIDRLEEEMDGYETDGTDLFTPEPYRVITAEGEVRWVLEYTKDLREDGQRNHLLGYLVDITERKRREQELAAREEKYRNLFEDTRDALMLMDRDGYRDCNQQALELFGVESVSEFVEYSPWEFSPPTQPDGRDSKGAALERIEEAFETGTAFFEWTHKRVDGAEFQAEVKLSRFEYDGEPVIHALVRDITERKEQKQELAAERNRIRAITNAIPDVTFVYDRAGRYREVLTGQRGLLADDVSELVGSDVTEVLPPDAAAAILEGIEDSLDTGTVQTVEYSLDLDGERTWFGGRIAPMPGDHQDEAVLLSRDITDRKEHERELEAREEKYRNLFEDTRDALMLLDRDGFFDCNERALDLFGAESVSEFVEYYPWELSPPTQPDGEDSKETALEHVETAFEEGEAFFEWTHQRVDGTEFPAEVKLSRFEHRGEPALHALVRDITERKEYERQLEEQRDNLETLNQVLRHDIRNDIQLITAYTEFLKTECEDDAVQSHIETVLENAEHAVELTKSGREMADVMLTADKELRRVNLHTVLQSEIQEVRSSYSAATISSETTIPSVQVRANNMLGSVFRNLLKNAIQHNDKESPAVAVGVTDPEDTVVVKIADNGPGIPPAQQDDIFGKGEKGLDSHGTGIGLYLVKTLVESYGGDVWVKDREGDLLPTIDEQEGAVFVVELPTATDE
ncbi:PAS domain-containing sensor histidine kinase [Halanaeroarchaeum sp. HSR-CO]|uniref:PAS domain-containing sensor histidine kinase n=1 Tax=Halanaeroarchaeum sp. HSR-CO TaxID=2866382 RepID=UPI00217E4A02|nr:PAS domain-containing sensor histidine kinase [Halanaeroarchaeum sp. HSR-CO]